MVDVKSASELPLCPICCDTLGKYGGPVTLPCGHNGCLHCLSSVQSRNAQCPLCRAPFEADQQLVLNHELRELVALATSVYMDEKTRQDGWEAFPTVKMTSEYYAQEFVHERGPHGTEYGSSCTALVPSAPDMQPSDAPIVDRDILLLEPPQWLPDSYAVSCGSCHQPFRALTRLRHHCRMCGKIFCNACCYKRLLLPPKYGQRAPQRVCELCSMVLLPLQAHLTGILSNAVQPPIHDSIDRIALRSWLNIPWSSTFEDTIYKSANILQTFVQASRLQGERGIPTQILSGAKALAVLAVGKFGAGWSYTVGSGLVVSRTDDGGWSAPCALACAGCGWGLQVGVGITDLLLVMHSEQALKTFCNSMHVEMGGNVNVTVGPVGRHAEATVAMGKSGAATMYSYSCSKGAFVGVSIDGTVMMVRHDMNMAFYGHAVTPRELLLERTIMQPPAASLLYDGLHSLMYKYESRSLATASQNRNTSRVLEVPSTYQEPARPLELPSPHIDIHTRYLDLGSQSVDPPSLHMEMPNAHVDVPTRYLSLAQPGMETNANYLQAPPAHVDVSRFHEVMARPVEISSHRHVETPDIDEHNTRHQSPQPQSPQVQEPEAEPQPRSQFSDDEDHFGDLFD